VKNTFKENKENLQKGFESPQMAKPKDNHIPMKEINIWNLKMAPRFTI